MFKKPAALLMLLLVACSAILLPVVSAAPTVPATALAASDAAPVPQLDYRVSLAPNQISDGTIEYFKSHNFTTVVLVAAEPVPYDGELQKIKQLGMYPILDVEHVIWNAGNNKSTPITQYETVLKTWKQAGWDHVATEGGRSGDFDALKDYFPKITFFNCDQCGLWKGGYRNSGVTEMSWETYYPAEIPSIQRGALVSYNLAKPQGITAGVWTTNNENLDYDTYKALLDWSYANGVGFTHFNVFFGLGATLADYHNLGLDAIASKLQRSYPPKPTRSWPEITVTSVRQMPVPDNSIAWDITNLGNREVWVAPYAVLHNATAALSGHLDGATILRQNSSKESSTSVAQSNGSGWALLGANESISILSPPSVPADTKGAAYNVYVYYNNSSRSWLYDEAPYTTVGAKPVPESFFGLFDYYSVDLGRLAMFVIIASVAIVLVLRLRQMRQK
jgi:hypothetical protein